jgi:hypothetical protein
LALRLGQTRGEDLAELIARKQYARAIEVIKEQVRSQKADTRVRLQLADVLVMAQRPQEAVAVLLPLADEYAREGFAAKAVAVLKRIQKIDPRRRDIESRLAALIEEKQRQATVPYASVPARVEFGFEEIQPGLEIGIEPLDEDEASVPAGTAEPAPVEDRDLAFGNAAPVELAPEPPPSRAPEPELGLSGGPELDLAASAAPELVLEPEPVGPVPHAPAAQAAAEPEIVLEPEPAAAEPMIVLEPIVEPEAAPRASGSPLGDDLFAQELMAVLEEAFPSGPAPAAPAAPAGAHASPAGEDGTRQVVVSPLFRDFSVDEMVAVIQGLTLLCYEAGEIIISEGEPGDSLYMLSAGRVKAFKRNSVGRQALLGEMSEGAFFGEISVLTGKPRSATVVAASSCELLELDRGTLTRIATAHPHVWDVLREYADRRMKGQRS